MQCSIALMSFSYFTVFWEREGWECDGKGIVVKRKKFEKKKRKEERIEGG